jgi:CRP-like cAMP-binding protein
MRSRMIDSDSLARFSLFADLTTAQLGEIGEAFDEERHGRGHRLVREGLQQSVFYVVVEGEAGVVVQGRERGRVQPGEFFGEVSVLTGEPPTADVVVKSEMLRCAALSGPDLRPLLLRFPHVAVRMLELGARRLRSANLWPA